MLLNEEVSVNFVIDEHNLKNFIIVHSELPYKLDINTDIYCFNLNLKIDNLDDSTIKDRKVIFCPFQQWIENQRTPSTNDFVIYKPLQQTYTNILTKFKIIIEIDRNEYEFLKNASDGLHSNVKNMIQSILSYISLKYNHSLMGREFVNIKISDCGAFVISCQTLENNENGPMTIIPGLGYSNDFKIQTLDFKNCLTNIKDLIWLYFFNYAIYSFNRSDFLNVILFCSISIESYLNYLLALNNLETKFNIYNENLRFQNKVPGFYTTLTFLKNENILKTDEIKTIKSCYGKIKNYRNDIVHGNIKQIILGKGKSQEALEQLYDFYMVKENNILKKC